MWKRIAEHRLRAGIASLAVLAVVGATTSFFVVRAIDDSGPSVVVQPELPLEAQRSECHALAREHARYQSAVVVCPIREPGPDEASLRPDGQRNRRGPYRAAVRRGMRHGDQGGAFGRGRGDASGYFTGLSPFRIGGRDDVGCPLAAIRCSPPMPSMKSLLILRSAASAEASPSPAAPRSFHNDHCSRSGLSLRSGHRFLQCHRTHQLPSARGPLSSPDSARPPATQADPANRLSVTAFS